MLRLPLGCPPCNSDMDPCNRMRDMPLHRDRDMEMPQDLGEHFSSMASRLKLNFRSTRCRLQSFPSFNKQLCKGESLPSELQELILARLPALTLLELKAVCRSWRDLLQSSSFKNSRQRMREERGDEWIDVWVMRSKEKDDLIAYVPAVDKYFLFLSLLYSPVMIHQPAFTFNLKDISIVCASWPLIVFGKEDWRSAPSFLMHDLHKSRNFQIPELHLQAGGHNDINSILPSSFPEISIDFPSSFRGLVVKAQSINYDRPRPLNTLFIYKLYARDWEHYPQSSATQADFSDMSAIVNGLFYQYDQEENTLYAWSVQHWSKAVITFSRSPHPDMPNRDLSAVENAEVNAFKVVRTQGGILLLTSTAQQQERGGVTQCFTVWKLMQGAEEAATWNWFEISRAPAELCLKGFNRESFAHPTAMFDGARICILSSMNEFSPALVYDVIQGSWYHLHGVFRDMQALFTTKVGVTIDGLVKKSDDLSRQFNIMRQNSRRYPLRGV